MYFYHAHAVALGEGFPGSTQPLTSHAPCSLSIGGGNSSASAGKFDNGLFSYDSAQSAITSRVDLKGGKNVYCTGVSIAIRNLNIRNMFTADGIVGRVTCEHMYDPADPKSPPEPDIITTGSHFDNLKIAGHPVDVQMVHEIFHDLPTHAACATDWAKGKDSRLRGTVLGSTIKSAPEDTDPWHLKEVHATCEKVLKEKTLGQTVLCSFVEKATITNAGEIETWGPIIKIPHFGTVYLGEVILCPGHRRINMFRLHMGSPDGGDIVGPNGGGNGGGYP